MPSWKNAGAFVSIAGAAAGLGAAAAQRIARSPLPQLSGTLQAPGLQAPVIIDRDAWGIPHIAASYAEDLFFASGFVHAQDRFWQMEMTRRVGSGRLSELFGAFTIEADRLMRHFGLRRVAEEEARQCAGECRTLLEAYCRGVNHYLTAFPKRAPLEFALVRLLPPPMLRWQPEPYTIADVLTLSKVMAFGLSVNWGSELVRAALLERLGAERASQLEPLYAAEFPHVMPGTSLPEEYLQRLSSAFAELQPFLAAAGAGGGGFSNNWVVDGSRTASGKPLLANDPHLQLQIPSIWYEMELNGAGFDVAGATFPGAPGIVIGHNRRLAWGVTNGIYDVQDLVIEQINPANPRQYRFRDEWRDGTLVREEIKVRGRGESVVDEVLITHHGPVISAALPGEERALALRWTALEPGMLFRSVLDLDRAGNWEEFVAALRSWDVPAQNFVYADVDGNIGYYTPGKAPIRARGLGALPVPGWTGEYEWTGYVPFEELPHAYNPPSHQVVTANNKLVGDDYPYFLGNEWLPGYRAQRISELLGDRTGLTVEDFQAMQRDVLSLPGLAAARVLRTLQGADEQEGAALARAAEWDGNLSAESLGGCICLVFQFQLLRATFGPILGDLTESYLGTGSSIVSPTNGFYSRPIPLLYRLLDERDDSWFTRMGAPGTTWDGVLREALSKSIAMLRERLGPDMSAWRWGRLNALRFDHVLGVRPPLDRVFSRGPVELGGDDNTVAAAALPLNNPFKMAGWASSYRQIVDLGALGNSISVHTTGQSGHVASEHYDDMIAAWRDFRYHPMSLPMGDIRRELGGHLALEPEKGKSDGESVR
ncbi:MAG TPA: penicillin acylase family protein [Chloroflexota bacterium]|nr:penicillin acylase family protein [Chloroflexota bacterium]